MSDYFNNIIIIIIQYVVHWILQYMNQMLM